MSNLLNHCTHIFPESLQDDVADHKTEATKGFGHDICNERYACTKQLDVFPEGNNGILSDLLNENHHITFQNVWKHALLLTFR